MLSPSTTKTLIGHFVTGRRSSGRRQALAKLTSLTARERDVVTEVAQGKPNAAIAKALFMSEPTVKTHITRMFAKLDNGKLDIRAVFAGGDAVAARNKRNPALPAEVRGALDEIWAGAPHQDLASAARPSVEYVPILPGSTDRVNLTEEFEWQGRQVRWCRSGSGPDVVFCHGTPWSARLWSPYAEALSDQFTVHLWDMPGYGSSSKHPDHRVSLDVQGEVLTALISHWGLRSPHLVAHDYGGAVALRSHLLHGCEFSSFALVDVVALAPWGSDFFRLVRDSSEVFGSLPSAVHEGALRAYIAGASHRGLTAAQIETLVSPWLGADGQAAFYRQIAQADQVYTDEIQGRYPRLDVPVLVVWGKNDTWIPVDRAYRLADLIPDAQLELIDAASHLIHFDQPVQLAMTLHHWLTCQG